MSEADGDEGAGAGGISLGSSSDSAPKTVEGKSLSTLSAIASGPGWTKVSCSCCMSERVEPLILVKLSEKVRPETKRWLIKLIGTSQKEGGKSCGNVTGPQDQSVFWPRIKHSEKKSVFNLSTTGGTLTCAKFASDFTLAFYNHISQVLDYWPTLARTPLVTSSSSPPLAVRYCGPQRSWDCVRATTAATWRRSPTSTETTSKIQVPRPEDFVVDR